MAIRDRSPASVAPSRGHAPTSESLKHWRAFGAADWLHVRDGVVSAALGSLLPVGLFYVALRTWSFLVAVAIVLGWSGLVFAWHWRRAHGADVFSASTFGFACFQAAIGLLLRDQTLYLAEPTLENLLYGGVFLGSALVGRPLLGLYARRLYPMSPSVQRSGAFRRAFLVASAVWFVGLALRGAVRIWLLLTLPLELYLVVNTIAGWPFSVALVGFTVWYPLRALQRAGLMIEAPVVEVPDEPVGDATP